MMVLYNVAVWVLAVLRLVSGNQNGIPRACVAPHDRYPFCDASLPLDQRLNDLIGRLSLEEKPLLLIGRESPKGNISRLGIPEYNWGGNCMHGVNSRCAPDGRCPTSFPNPNTLGAAFNETLWKAMGSVMGVEMRALWLQNVAENRGGPLPHLGLDCWSPNLGIQRDPRWGRNMETPSEDPFLCGRYGVQYTLGLQNNTLDPRYLQIVSTVKHFDANSLEGFWFANGTWGRNAPVSRHTLDAKISLYDLYSSYLPAFRASVVEGGAAGVMCSYNRVNGVPSCANDWLLRKVLRNEWKFRGYVSSDTGAVVDILKYHHYTHNWTETVAAAINAGCDVNSAAWTNGKPFATGGPYMEYLPDAVREGLVKESAIDAALRNALGIRFRLGLFDPIDDQPFWHVPPNVVGSEENVRLAKEATAQGLVLLKNHGDLVPLSPTQRIAVIGPHANDRFVMLGNYAGQVCANDRSNRCVTSFFEGISAVVKRHGGYASNATGCDVNGNSTAGFKAAIKAAKNSDIVVFVGGLDMRIEDEGLDRHDVGLPQIQVDLIHKIQSVNENVVIVLLHGGMVAVDDISTVPALISAGYPGRYAGSVLAEAIFGITSKAWGKLPVTWYKRGIVDELNMVSFDMSRAPGRTYRYYMGEAIYEFGHGLNPLTNFELTLASVERNVDGKDGCKFSIQVTNVGSREGDEVILAFFKPVEGVVPSSEPASRIQKQLFGFERRSLQSSESGTVSFEVTASTLEMCDTFGKPKSFAGKYLIQFTNGNGASVAVNVTLSDTKTLRAESNDMRLSVS